MKKVRQRSSDENASTSEFGGRERRGEAPRQLLHVDRAHLADQSDQQLNLGDIILLLLNISTCTLHHQTGVHLSSQSSSTTSSHSWLGMLMHSVVGTIAHTWLRIGIGTLMRMMPMLVKGYVGVVYHLSRHILTRLLWHQGALLPFYFFTIIFQLSFTNLKLRRLESQSIY